MSNQPATFNKTVRVEETLWDRAGEVAGAQDSNRAAEINAFLRWYIGEPGAVLPKRAMRPGEEATPSSDFYLGIDYAACGVLERELKFLPLTPLYRDWLNSLAEDQDNRPDTPGEWSDYRRQDVNKALSLDHLDPAVHKGYRIRTTAVLTLAWMLSAGRQTIHERPEQTDSAVEEVATVLDRYWKDLGRSYSFLMR